VFEAERIWPLGASKLSQVFRFQYALCEQGQTAHYLPQEFQFGGRQLLVGEDLTVVHLSDRDGDPIGFLLGIAVGPDGLLAGEHRLGVAQSDPDFWHRFESFLIDCAGRYTFFIKRGEEQRLYCDPVGMNGVVYEVDAHRVASSPLLAIDRSVIPNQRYEVPFLKSKDTRFTLHHTCDDRVKRLNPNCYLDLNSFKIHRFWPRDETFALGQRSHADVYDDIIERLAFNIDQITSGHDCVMPISGGRDSRILASVGRNSLHKLRMFYTHVKNRASGLDAHVGKGVAQTLGVDHQVLGGLHDDYTKRWERNFLAQAYAITHGSQTPPPQEYERGLLQSIAETSVILRGHQTDILRAVYVFHAKDRWRRHGWQLKRMIIVPFEDFTHEIAAHFKKDFFDWQNTLPENAMEKAADFMFLEVYYNSTIGASFPALWQHFYMSPFNSRRLIGLSLCFDEAERRASQPVYDIVQKCAPECARIPFAGEGDVRFPKYESVENYAQLSEPRYSETAARLRAYYGEPD